MPTPTAEVATLSNSTKETKALYEQLGRQYLESANARNSAMNALRNGAFNPA
jgi:hypothetical protein